MPSYAHATMEVFIQSDNTLPASAILANAVGALLSAGVLGVAAVAQGKPEQQLKKGKGPAHWVV
ncbi:hypothetical protein [Spirosoma aerolatum]|uniref:hypothetical protein n=1 Tax=Spirosoma aerolatum TaxID=1211326 RepID=UPI0009AE9951|nr:hypothetical protein [Spirosoma aerolatum]